jgi:hypothetical protein
MPRLMPPAVERALREVLAWRNAAVAPIDFYMAIRDALETQMTDRGSRFSMEEITRLAASIADWCPHPSIRIFLFGSRVRGDHRDDSDVDLCIKITDYSDEAEAAHNWWRRQDQAFFKEELPEGCPGPLCVTREDQDDERWLWEKLLAADPLHRDRNVTCVILPPASPKAKAAQEERRRRRAGVESAPPQPRSES